MKFASFDNVLMASALVSFAVFLAWSVKIIAEGVWRLGVAHPRQTCLSQKRPLLRCLGRLGFLTPLQKALKQQLGVLVSSRLAVHVLHAVVLTNRDEPVLASKSSKQKHVPCRCARLTSPSCFPWQGEMLQSASYPTADRRRGRSSNSPWTSRSCLRTPRTHSRRERRLADAASSGLLRSCGFLRRSFRPLGGSAGYRDFLSDTGAQSVSILYWQEDRRPAPDCESRNHPVCRR